MPEKSRSCIMQTLYLSNSEHYWLNEVDKDYADIFLLGKEGRSFAVKLLTFFAGKRKNVFSQLNAFEKSMSHQLTQYCCVKQLNSDINLKPAKGEWTR